jgi:hypothetical protein
MNQFYSETSVCVKSKVEIDVKTIPRLTGTHIPGSHVLSESRLGNL